MRAFGPRRAPAADRRARRPARWAVALLVLMLLGGAGTWLAIRSDGAAPAVAATHAPVVARDTGHPVALASTPPVDVPVSVVADVPGLPPAAKPVALAETSQVGGGVRARLADLRAVNAHARIPGEVSGPALRLIVELTNTTGSPVSLDAVAVNLYTGVEGAPAVPVTEQSGPHLTGSLAPGASAEGTYAFTVPQDRRDLVTVTVAVGPQVGTAVFSGPVR
ncbi:MAG: hypothetical protein JWO98_3430 [Frankiales bacterium]|nr:hypothetical protein [Frankiales bacterium]